MITSAAHKERLEEARNAFTRFRNWQAEGNAARKAGNAEKAQKCFDKSKSWFNRFQRITGSV